MIIFHNSKNLSISVKKLSSVGKVLGLMFRTKNTKNLLFEFNKPTKMSIHSFFVFFDFVAVWIDDENKILEYQVIKPFQVSIKPKNNFSKLIELPLNNKNKTILSSLVGKRNI